MNVFDISRTTMDEENMQIMLNIGAMLLFDADDGLYINQWKYIQFSSNCEGYVLFQLYFLAKYF